MKTGIATIPLDYGRCPKWLFERMKRLSRGIMIAIAEEFGEEEILRRLSDPVWFQSLGCVIAFDWNSSGLTTTTLGALKEGLRGLERDLGIFICGGKGKTSRKTPQQIQQWGEFLSLSQENVEKLIYASKITAKVDSSLIQDGFQVYHHNLIFSKSGNWTVVQQGMNIEFQKARRYHWSSFSLFSQKKEKEKFIEEPHSGIASEVKVKPLNLTAKKSSQTRKVSFELATTSPKTFLNDLSLIQRHPKQPTLMELNNVEFRWHKVVEERFDLKRLQKTIFSVKEKEPQSFEEFLSLKGVGPKTIRALSLVAEVIYGAKPSFEDPARYSFAHGGKDGTPYPVDRDLYDKTLEVLEKGIKKSNVSIREKNLAQKRLHNLKQEFLKRT